MKYQKIIIIILSILCIACTKDKTDNQKFKQEYEQYNQEYLKLEIPENNIIQYKTIKEINQIIKKKSGVIFIGTPTDNLSRKAIEVLLDVADNTSLEEINYIDSLDKIEGLNEIENLKSPLVLFIKEGKIQAYHIGTISDKTKLDEEEEIELYNIYLEGIQKILQDSCDERC